VLVRYEGEPRPEVTGETPATELVPHAGGALVPFQERAGKRGLRETEREEPDKNALDEMAGRLARPRASPGRDDFHSTSVSASDAAERREDSYNAINPLAHSAADDSTALTATVPWGALRLREEPTPLGERQFAAGAPGYEARTYRKGQIAERMREELGATGAAYSRQGPALQHLGEVVQGTKMRAVGVGQFGGYTPEEWGLYFEFFDAAPEYDVDEASGDT